jgi:hypothetical protein
MLQDESLNSLALKLTWSISWRFFLIAVPTFYVANLFGLIFNAMLLKIFSGTGSSDMVSWALFFFILPILFSLFCAVRILLGKIYRQYELSFVKKVGASNA